MIPHSHTKPAWADIDRNDTTRNFPPRASVCYKAESKATEQHEHSKSSFSFAVYDECLDIYLFDACKARTRQGNEMIYTLLNHPLGRTNAIDVASFP